MEDHIHINISMLFTSSILTICFFLITTLPQSHCQPSQPVYDYSIWREHSYSCGNLSNIFYPFWGQGRPSYCGGGDPFHLNCHNDQETTILIGSLNFTVLHINPKTHSMRIKGTDLAHDVCSPQINDTYLIPSLFRYDPSVANITMFYNCSSEYISQSICGPQNNAICHVGAEDELLEEFPELERCEQHIQVPAGIPLEPYYYNGTGIIDRDGLERVLDEGFQVEYTTNKECIRCLGSEGECWSSDIDKHVQQSCYYCTDGSTALLCSVLNTPHHKSKLLNRQRKIILGSSSSRINLNKQPKILKRQSSNSTVQTPSSPTQPYPFHIQPHKMTHSTP